MFRYPFIIPFKFRSKGLKDVDVFNYSRIYGPTNISAFHLDNMFCVGSVSADFVLVVGLGLVGF